MKATAIAIALAVLAGCVSVGKTVLVPGLAPVPVESVQIFLPGDSVPPHTRIAILEAESNDSMNSANDILNKLREEAAALGADAVVIVGQEAESDVSQATRALVTGYDLGGRVATQAFAVKLAPD